MYLFIILGVLLFQNIYGEPVCTAIKYTGVVYETNGLFNPTNTVCNYNFYLNVTQNYGNSTYPNVLTVTGFTESYASGYSRTSPLQFVIDSPDGQSNVTVSCPTMNGTSCVIISTNGFAESTFDLNYLTVYDTTNLFVSNGGIYDGINENTVNSSVCLSGISADITSKQHYYRYNQTACCIQYTDYNITVDPEEGDYGTACASDPFLAWLDIVYVIDISSAMPQINDLLSSIATIMEGLNVGQVGDHSTRVSIVTYGNIDVQVLTKLADTTNEDDFEDILFNININPNDPGGNIAGALNQAFDIITSQRGYRKPVIVLAAAAYNPQGVQNINGTVAQIRANGIDIAVINYAAVDGVLATALKTLASDGYYYISIQNDLISAVSYGLTQINCFCSSTTKQLRLYNSQWSNYTSYADCFRAVPDAASPTVANKRDCHPGSLIALTDQQKFDFITDNFFLKNETLYGKKQMNIGFHKSASDGLWKWWGYNGTEIPYNNYPLMIGTPGPNDNYGYMVNDYGYHWALKTGHNVASPYICQTRACDVSYVCK
jgi:hypothetical protein|uniref:VWFA domain-containing protein n=1 Tax=Panagrolaimus sp. PS1159 TaxID=55785 RepID=A0AC35F630_9BILA